MKIAQPLLALSLAVVLSGCTARAGELRDARDEELAEASFIEEANAWQSAPATRSLWITLPSYTPVRIPHGLGREPTLVIPYLSYTRNDKGKANERQYSIGAGDVATISDVTEESLIINNRSYAEFYVRVVLQ